MKEELIKLAQRVENVRKNSRLPAYQQSELTEIKYKLLNLTNEAKHFIIISQLGSQTPLFLIKSNDTVRELSLRNFKQQDNPNIWINHTKNLQAEIIDANEGWPQIGLNYF